MNFEDFSKEFADLRRFDHPETQSLAESIFDQSVQLHGQDVYYLIADFNDIDLVVGESSNVTFDAENMFEIKLFPTGLYGDYEPNQLFTRTGSRSVDDVVFQVSKGRFAHESLRQLGYEYEPKPGDAIFLKLTEDLWKVKFPERSHPYYAHGKSYVWEFMASRKKKSSEVYNTGHEEIDAVNDLDDVDSGDEQVQGDNERIYGNIADIIDEETLFGDC